MKKFLRALGAFAFLAVLLFAGATWYSTTRGYTRWYFRVNGQVVINGEKTTGYMHADTKRTLLMLTRTDGLRPETYIVSLGSEKAVFDCGEWHPLRFLPVPVGDVNPPCSVFTVDPAKVHDPPITATLARGPHLVEFSTLSGKKVTGHW